MMAEERILWKEKGNMAVRSALEETESFMMKVGEAGKESANLKPCRLTGTGSELDQLCGQLPQGKW
jgi:hypothetical protein